MMVHSWPHGQVATLVHQMNAPRVEGSREEALVTRPDAAAHLLSRAARERQQRYPSRIGTVPDEAPGALDDGERLASARARQHQGVPATPLDRGTLLHIRGVHPRHS